MPDSWIDKKDLEELVDSLPSSKKGRRKRKALPRTSVVQQGEEGGLPEPKDAEPADGFVSGVVGEPLSPVAVCEEQGEKERLGDAQDGDADAIPEPQKVSGMTPLEMIATDPEATAYQRGEFSFPESIFELDLQEEIEDDEAINPNSGGSIGEADFPHGPPSFEDFEGALHSELVAEPNLHWDSEDCADTAAARNLEGSCDELEATIDALALGEAEGTSCPEEIEAPVIVEALDSPDGRRRVPEFLEGEEEEAAEPVRRLTPIERDADRAFRALADARAKAELAGLLRTRGVPRGRRASVGGDGVSVSPSSELTEEQRPGTGSSEEIPMGWNLALSDPVDSEPSVAPEAHAENQGAAPLPESFESGEGHVSLFESFEADEGHVSLPESFESGEGHVSLPESFEADEGHVSLFESFEADEGHVSLFESFEADEGAASVPESFEIDEGDVSLFEPFEPDDRESAPLEFEILEACHEEISLEAHEFEVRDEVFDGGALRERIFRLGEQARLELRASGLVICDEHGLPLYISNEADGHAAPPAALLLELSGRTNESLGLGREGVIQIADGEGGWRCLLPSEGGVRPLYAGLSLERPLEHGEIERLAKALAAAVHPLPPTG